MNTNNYSFIQFNTFKRNNVAIEEEFYEVITTDILNNFITKVIKKNLSSKYLNEYKHLLQHKLTVEIPSDFKYVRVYLDVDVIDDGEYDLSKLKLITFDLLKNISEVLDLNIRNTYIYYNRVDAKKGPIKVYINRDVEKVPDKVYTSERLFNKLFE